MKDIIAQDLLAQTGKKQSVFSFFLLRRKMIGVRFVYALRKANFSSSFIVRSFYDIKRFRMRRRYGLEIHYAKIGGGFRIVHPYNVTVSDKAVLGNNVTLYKGVTIGESFRGLSKGAPVIGDDVWMGPNATVVGNVRIGNDVLIAPNAFVNCDVPDHSVVIGNPGIIHFRKNATEGYFLYNSKMKE